MRSRAMNRPLQQRVKVGPRLVGEGRPVFIVAEVGVNHNGSLALARALVDSAAVSGADAVKFQSFSAEKLVSAWAPLAPYQRDEGKGRQREMLRALELGEREHRQLKGRCERRGVLFLSTPYDEESADFLESLSVPAYKVGSGELTNLPFLRYLARKGKPLIVSTGMAEEEEVAEALETIYGARNRKVILLHCTSSYPTEVSDAHLRAIPFLRERFGHPVGFSDHTLGPVAAIGAVALGACLVEKHFTLDRNLPGPDHKASIEPEGMRAMVLGIREVEAALGEGRKRPRRAERSLRLLARRSIVAASPIPRGSVIEERMLTLKRPASGLPPRELPRVLGRRARRYIAAEEALSWDMLS